MVFKKKTPGEETEKKPKKHDWKKLIEEGKVYIIQDRHLKRADEEIADDLSNAKHYRLESDGMYIFDFDRYLAQPQMKDILAKMGMYTETKMLWWVLAMLTIVVFFMLLFFVRLPSKGYIDESIIKINTTAVAQPQQQPRTLQDLIP